jgi:nitric oxide reductase NorE protein
MSTLSEKNADEHGKYTDERGGGVRITRNVPGEEGVWVFLLGDMTIFIVLFASYFYYRSRQPDLFNAGQRTLHQGYGVIGTLLLLTSSLCVVAGVRGFRQRRGIAASWLFGGALLCGLGFTAIKFFEYGEKLRAGITPATDNFYTYYFMLTGLHFFHLLLGMCVLVFVIRKARQPEMAPGRLVLVEGGACYWHMVDLLWIVLFPLLYLVR